MSFNTTVGVVVLLKDIHRTSESTLRYVHNASLIKTRALCVVRCMAKEVMDLVTTANYSKTQLRKLNAFMRQILRLVKH